MDTHEYDEKHYDYPDSPQYCDLEKFVKCCNSKCNAEENREGFKNKCKKCQIWLWRFGEANNILPGDLFFSLVEANYAEESHIVRDSKKQYRIAKIEHETAKLIGKFEVVRQSSLSGPVCPVTPSPNKQNDNQISSSVSEFFPAKSTLSDKKRASSTALDPCTTNTVSNDVVVSPTKKKVKVQPKKK